MKNFFTEFTKHPDKTFYIVFDPMGNKDKKYIMDLENYNKTIYPK